MCQVCNPVVKKRESAYVQWIVEAEDPRWLRFAGMCLLAGWELGWDVEKIWDYVSETYHSMDLDIEVPLEYSLVQEDMNLYHVES